MPNKQSHQQRNLSTKSDYGPWAVINVKGEKNEQNKKFGIER